MEQATISKLLSVNRQFYQTFAEAFDATRQRIQPGVQRVLARVLDLIPNDARILDLGCGNGELARELARRGFRGTYTGVDFSEGLLQAARETCQVFEQTKFANLTGLTFVQRDLTAPDWEVGLEGPFDVVMAFAVLHHLPVPFHAEIVRKVRALLARHSEELPRRGIPETSVAPLPEKGNDQPASGGFLTGVRNDTPLETSHSEEALRRGSPETGVSPLPEKGNDQPASGGFLADARNDRFEKGIFILSNWQFLNSPRWQARIQPWERVGLTREEVELDDYLLDWRRGGEGLRYVHHFSEAELDALAGGAGFEIVESFDSDGKEGNLGLYQIWRPV